MPIDTHIKPWLDSLTLKQRIAYDHAMGKYFFQGKGDKAPDLAKAEIENESNT